MDTIGLFSGIEEGFRRAGLRAPIPLDSYLDLTALTEYLAPTFYTIGAGFCRHVIQTARTKRLNVKVWYTRLGSYL